LTASLPRWTIGTRVRRRKNKNEPLEEPVRAKISRVVGPISSYVSHLREFSIGRTKYNVQDKHVGNANVGYVLVDENREKYHVGIIHKIMEVKCGRHSPPRIIFQIQRYKEAPNTMWTFITDKVLFHSILGIRIVGSEVEDNFDIVALEQIVGHVAVNSFHHEGKRIQITIQLSEVFVLSYLVSSSEASIGRRAQKSDHLALTSREQNE
jgi:hypothetical protein